MINHKTSHALITEKPPLTLYTIHRLSTLRGGKPGYEATVR